MGARSLDRDPTAAPGTLELSDYLSVLRRRRWTILLTVTVVLAAVVAFSLWQIPVYESSVRIVLHPPTASGDGSAPQVVLDQRQLETQVELIVSTGVAEIVNDRLALQMDPDELTGHVEARVVDETNVIEVTARSTSPQRAADLAQGFADGYLEFRRRQQQQSAADAVTALEGRVQQVRDALNEVQARKAAVTGDRQAAVAQEEAALLDQLRGLSGELAVQRARQTTAGPDGEVIETAQVPASPSSPDVVRDTVLALILGTVLGLGLAFLRDSLDDRLRTDDAVERATGEPVISRIPAWKQKKRHGPQIVALTAPTSPAAEAYRSLRTNLRFLAVGRPFRSLLVTSAVQGEGKTTTASNLAVASALAGSHVLLVGADLRRPQLARLFGRDGGSGLSDVLAGSCALEDAIVDVDVANLRVLPSGRVPPNPAELLASDALTALIGKLEQLADLVILDGPPVLPTADALELAARVGAVVLVIDAASQPRLKPVQVAADRVRNVGGALVGTVVTKVEAAETYYGYGYGDR